MYDRSAMVYDAIYATKDYAAEARRLREILARQQRNNGTDLLDVGCGTGGHIPFLAPHFTIEGLDQSAEMLVVARRRHPGIPFHRADMTSFDLGRRFDAVVCLFSAIGYVRTVSALHQTIANFARHLNRGGVVAVEPWFAPDAWSDGHIGVITVDQPELKISRMNVSRRDGTRSIMDMHHLVATPDGVEHFVERHEMGLFMPNEYRAAFVAAGLEPSYDDVGLMGRGLHLGVRA